MNWKDYHKERHDAFLKGRMVKSIKVFSDVDKISLAEEGATCYDPRDEDGWDTRIWLERIHCVLEHGCCTGCNALKKCRNLSALPKNQGGVTNGLFQV